MMLATGGGKTACLAWILLNHVGAACVMAHRNELVGQLSATLAKYGVYHDIIAAKDVRAAIARQHMEDHGVCYYRPGARIVVASVQTITRAKDIAQWAAQVTLWITDEGHHLVLDNMWHRAISLFTHPQCRGLMPTATPGRADGKGLGRHADGVADVMVQGPPMRWLIEEGYLTDYRIVCPTSDLALLLAQQDVGSSGDYTPKQLRDAARRSHIVGDVVQEYRRWAPGLLGATFTSDVETANEITHAYLAAGVRAATLTGDTDAGVRRSMLRQLAAGHLDQLVTVDIVSEGFDLPALQVITMARKSESLPLVIQQAGRLLRPIYAPGPDLETTAGRLEAIAMSNKPKGLWIDQVGNFQRHGGGPDKPRVWSLDAREGGKRGAKSDAIPLRACSNPVCAQPFERFRIECPHCGRAIEPPAGRKRPEQVDGDLFEVDPETLATLRGDVDRVDMPSDEYARWCAARGAPPISIPRNVKRHEETQAAQAALRDAMAQWGGWRHHEGLTVRETQRLWFLTFGVDVLGAMALGAREAAELEGRVRARIL